jgi:hypothetical protein
MPDNLVLDANIINEFIKSEKGCAEVDCTADLMEIITQSYFIAIDEGDRIEMQWQQTCNCELFKDWITEQFKNGKIRKKRGVRNQSIRNSLITKYGFPFNDLIYIWVALDTVKKYIITEDVHFFDPKKKKSSSKTISDLKKNSKGNVLKYLRGEGITVACIENAYNDL